MPSGAATKVTYAPLKATRYATRTFKRLMYHTCEHPETFLKPVTAEIEEFERGLLAEQRWITKQARLRFASGRDREARDLLTRYVHRRLLDALDLGERLVRQVEHETRERFGIRMPTGRDLPGETARPESQSMNRDDVLTEIVFCFWEGIDDYPREHGSYRAAAGLLPALPHPVSRQEFLDAMAAVRGEHDPARDWRAFAEAVWREATRQAGPAPLPPPARERPGSVGGPR